jgi:DNA-binding response OmpR family regulator
MFSRGAFVSSDMKGAERSRMLVCVIDDDTRMREAVCVTLHLFGFKTVQAGDGDLGLELVRQHKPAIVITDIVMPNREGLETIRAVKQEFPTMPIIAMSGSDPGKDYLELAQAMGADNYLAKPFKPSELLEKVASLVATPAARAKSAALHA